MNSRITKTLGIIAGIIALFVVSFVVLPIQEVSAQSNNGGDLPACTGEPGEIEGVTCESVPIPYPNPGDEDTAPTPSSPASTPSQPKDPQFGCSLWGWGGIKGCMAALAYTVMSFFAIFLGIAGLLLNAAVELTIQNMSIFVNGPDGTSTAIEVGWKLFRDLGNIVILFVLLFSAIGTILRTDKIVPRGTLAKVIIAAFLINFSLFFTKIIIDVSNVFTFTIHEEIKKISETGSDDPLTFGVAGAFMNGLNPIRVYQTLQAEQEQGKPVEPHIFQQMIFGSIVMLVATFVFLAMAMMLLVRFAILMMLLITSPIGVVGGLIPKLKTYSDQWWTTLVGQAMFAPVLMLFMLLTILLINKNEFMSALNSTVPTAGLDSVTAKTLAFLGSGIGGALQYVIVIALMIMGLVIAKSVAGKFGSGAVDWVSKKAGSMAFGGTAWVGRQALGRVGEGLATSSTVGRLAASKSPLYSGLGKGLSLAGNQMKSGSYDFRATGGAITSQLGAGKAGGAGGLTAARKARAEAIQARAEKYAVNRGVAAQEAEIELRQQKLTSAQQAYAAAPLASAAKATARTAQLKAEKDLETAKEALIEMKGGVRASKVREELTEASEKLTAAQRKDADTHMKLIDTQEELIKTMDERIKINGNDNEARQKKAELEANLANYKSNNITNNPDLQAYIAAQRNYESVKKAASSISTAEKRTIAEEYLGSMSQARRTAGDSLLKGKEKPEESLTKALKQMMQSGGGGGGNQQQNNAPAAGAGNAGNTPAPQGGAPAPQTPRTP